MKVMELSCEPGKYVFWCPACRCCHWFSLDRWNWNYSVDKATVRASILVYADKPDKRCHLYITDGKIDYLGDCHHAFAGKTVEMEHVPGTEGAS